MQRDNTRAEVPVDASIRPLIEEQWRGIMRQIFDGLPYDEGLRFAERLLKDREDTIEEGGLNAAYDWQYDLYVARFHHQWNLDHSHYNQKTRDRLLKYWETALEQNRTPIKEMGLSGLKTVLLIHGAVAVGALNIIAQVKPENLQLLLAAKLGLAFSLVGIMMVGLGQVMMIIKIGDLNSKLSGRLASQIKWNKLRAFGRYTQRYFRFLKYANLAIYGSVGWFCVYCVVLYIVIVS